MVRRVACLTLLLGVMNGSPEAAQQPRATQALPQPSFDCAQANNAAERMICASLDLVTADLEMASAFKAAVARTTSVAARKALQTDQARWRALRNACTDKVATAHQCIADGYRTRTAALTGATR